MVSVATIYAMCYSWVGLVSKNYEIERACMELEAEVQDLEHKAKKIKKWYCFVIRIYCHVNN